MVAVVVHVSRQGEARCKVKLSLHHLRLNEFLQVGPTQTAVPVVRDVTPVHDLAEQVAQVIIRHLGIRVRGDAALLEGGSWCLVEVACLDFQLRLQTVVFVILAQE